jgi:hypothetical protein
MSENGQREFKMVGDGRGTMQGKFLLNQDREIDRLQWILECFPNGGSS